VTHGGSRVEARSAPGPRERVTVITNSTSGAADYDRMGRIEAALRALGDVSLCEPQSVETFGREVRDAARAAEIVVVAGGDGTMNRAVNALEDRLDDLVFALVPMGTGNDLARTLGLPLDPEEGAVKVVEGSVRSIDYGRVCGEGVRRLFTNACMGGFPVAVNEAITADTKRRLGSVAFWLGGARAAAELERATVRLNGMEVADCVAAGVGNGRTCGGGIAVWPSAAPDDGLLDGCALGAPNHARALQLAAKVRSGSHEQLESVATERASSITMEADPPMEINVDGELVGLTTPATFEIAGRLRVRC
jgi:diacylglycerol kinase (ATP)